jgi:hypothetical protein
MLAPSLRFQLMTVSLDATTSVQKTTKRARAQ